MTQNGVIETASGDLLRSGFCDFEHDGSFEPSTETHMSNVPFPSKCKGDEGETKMDRWNGLEWIEVDQP